MKNTMVLNAEINESKRDYFKLDDDGSHNMAIFSTDFNEQNLKLCKFYITYEEDNETYLTNSYKSPEFYLFCEFDDGVMNIPLSKKFVDCLMGGNWLEIDNIKLKAWCLK